MAGVRHRRRTRPQLRSYADELYDGLLALVTRVLEGVRGAGRLPADTDVALESRRLCALLDGLCLEAVLHPGRLDAETMLAVLRGHLTALAARNLPGALLNKVEQSG